MTFRAERVRRWAMYSHTLLVLAFLLLPLLVIVPVSLTSGNTLIFPTPGVSLRWYEEVVTDPRWVGALWNSLLVGVSSTMLATIMGVLAAIGLAWGSFPGRKLIYAVAAAPLVAPIVIVGVASFSFYATLGLVGNRLSLVLTHAALAVPVVLTTVTASLAGFDRTLMRAAASLGAGHAQAVVRVLLPLIAPGVATGALIAFIISFDEVVVASFLSVAEQRTLPRLIFSGVRESVSPAIAAAAILLIAFSACLLGLVGWIQSRSKRGARL
ncbi:ABC transporter permease [Dongia deserti]|uniref:ABC transporter permease n=1 Tax=Dongia deserti TaxID=2268030 RepID=UPI000E6539F8|nr:ABC transporter permease [Dongia deserti]